MEEVLVLAHHDPGACAGMLPDPGVGRLRQTHIQHVQALHAAAGQIARQRDGQLVIDKESHEASRTG